MVQDGRVAALWGGGVGWPGFTAVAKAPGGARFIVPDAPGLKKIQARHAFLKPLTVPAGSYPGQDAPIASLGSWSFIMARPGLAGDAARSEEHTSELQSQSNLVCRLLLEKKKKA